MAITLKIHVMPTKSMAQEAVCPASDECASKRGGGTGIFYHGGPILYATNVATIYWSSAPIYANGPAAGTSSTTGSDGDNSLVGQFLRPRPPLYFNINTTYYNGTNAHVQNVVNYTQYWANTSIPADGASVTDAQMLSMLQAGIAKEVYLRPQHQL